MMDDEVVLVAEDTPRPRHVATPGPLRPENKVHRVAKHRRQAPWT